MRRSSILPATTERVELHTPENINVHNRESAWQRLSRYEGASQQQIASRLGELKHEWDIERSLEAVAATVALVGLGLAASVDRRWLILPAISSLFLMQHAMQGWCPPVPMLRRAGVRTQDEINSERMALKVMRGDLRPVARAREALDQVDPPHRKQAP